MLDKVRCMIGYKYKHDLGKEIPDHKCSYDIRNLTGATAIVSTLFTVVGQPKTPTSAGNGGFRRGFPAFPSSDSISDCQTIKPIQSTINPARFPVRRHVLLISIQVSFITNTVVTANTNIINKILKISKRARS